MVLELAEGPTLDKRVWVRPSWRWRVNEDQDQAGIEEHQSIAREETYATQRHC